MKIVIDIPDCDYYKIREMNVRLHEEMMTKASLKDWENANTILNLLESVKNGTPLPKGHGALIDRSKLVFYRCKENVMDCPPNYDFTCQNCEYGWTCKLNIDEAPIVIPADKGEKE